MVARRKAISAMYKNENEQIHYKAARHKVCTRNDLVNPDSKRRATP